jgi:hypothetical protein
MMTMKPGSVLQMTMSVAALSAALAACGGGSDSPYKPITDPQTPTSPTTPTPPTGPTTPPPPPPPPTDPAPGDNLTVTLADTVTPLTATNSTSVQNWPAWIGTNQPIDNVNCASTVSYHIHTLLTIYRDGTRLALPDNVGRGGCTHELHTHDGSGVIHNETSAPKKFMLSQFFSLWRQPFTSTNVAGLTGPFRYYLIENGKLTRYTGDPMALELTAYREIVILTGANPPTVLPKYSWTPGL